MGNKAACTFCNFKSVCQFDESLEDNQFRSLKDMKDSEAMEKIRGGWRRMIENWPENQKVVNGQMTSGKLL